jgi:hypothetical protein
MKKKGHPKIKYMMPEGCLVQPFVKLGIRKPDLGEFLASCRTTLIPHLEP